MFLKYQAKTDPKLNKYIELNSANKILIGFFLTFLSFLIITVIQHWIDLGKEVNISWQLLAYAILTSGEIFVSITCLEISYTHAPKQLKTITVSLFLLSIAIGNIYTSFINFINERDDGTIILAGANYFLFFSILMFVVTILFIPFIKKFSKEKILLQD